MPLPVAARDVEALALDRDGAERMQGAVGREELGGLEATLCDLCPDQAGVRLQGITGLRPFLDADGIIGRIATSQLGPKCKPVRGILFDKTTTRNWSLPWHQDRTIAVRERIQVEGFGPWTTKHGMLHVAPPFAVLARMVPLRLHLDVVPESNAPLLVAPGSHRLGRIAEGDIAAAVRRCGSFAYLADRGDVWIYSTQILHASEAARNPAHRRVLQVDFAAEDLPGGLDWLGV